MAQDFGVTGETLAKYAEVEGKAVTVDIRMGINLGDVIIQGDDIYGDGINIASRLEGLAEPDVTM